MGNCFPTPFTSFPATPKLRNASVYSAGDQENSNASSSGDNYPPGKGEGRIVTPNLKIYTFSELKNATKNFKAATMLGEGGFGSVYKGWVDEKTLAPSRVGFGIPVAVKKSNPDGDQGLKEWQAEVRFLGKFSHPNLVKLLGYCWEDRELLLVYEYMQKGSLESHLFRNGAEPLPWKTRIKIVIGAARGLSFLHATEKQVIYRDLKTANILLDGEFNAKLSDFGLAKLGPIDGNSHVSTGVVGTYGYAAPEYMATGHLYVSSDVYGFGVVLLEVLTGRRVLDVNRPKDELNLVQWATPLLSKKGTLRRIMDPKLEHRYPIKAAFEAATLILKCLESEPRNRPSIDEVLSTLEQINNVYMTPEEPKVNNVKNPGARRGLNNHRYRN
ncbi:probable serine/threonine-protein kinase PIX13 [Daucus carota subsp. sativus]|uniref:probable serine/threonine-protein kinase PIX13 n=1 Tax=Daucus carota subsp. sativus TaxID=79200 RepID=UPI0007EF1D78|nr:PREDICTED: probable serine/threonine-protein kinase Cx32, chloroplastic [Daucus carota subsp. sativus]